MFQENNVIWRLPDGLGVNKEEEEEKKGKEAVEQRSQGKKGK